MLERRAGNRAELEARKVFKPARPRLPSMQKHRRHSRRIGSGLRRSAWPERRLPPRATSSANLPPELDALASACSIKDHEPTRTRSACSTSLSRTNTCTARK
jgi:hypothetical protein